MINKVERQKYFDQKNETAYKFYSQNRFEKKVRAIVRRGDKFYVLYNKFKNIYGIAGGGVEDNETIEQACVREIQEELGINAKVTNFIEKVYYNSKQTYKNKTFISKRVEFYFLCDYVSDFPHTKLGIAGEFSDSVEVKLISKDQFLQTDFGRFSKRIIKALKKALNE